MQRKDVWLTWHEYDMALCVGVHRQTGAMADGKHDRAGSKKGLKGLNKHQGGAACEYAVAKYFGWLWNGSQDAYGAEPDLRANVQVRARFKHSYDLIVRDTDHDDQAFVLVTWEGEEFRIHGWILGADAKRPEWRKNWGDHGWAFFVPKDVLRDLEELVQWEQVAV